MQVWLALAGRKQWSIGLSEAKYVTIFNTGCFFLHAGIEIVGGRRDSVGLLAVRLCQDVACHLRGWGGSLDGENRSNACGRSVVKRGSRDPPDVDIQSSHIGIDRDQPNSASYPHSSTRSHRLTRSSRRTSTILRLESSHTSRCSAALTRSILSSLEG